MIFTVAYIHYIELKKAKPKQKNNEVNKNETI